MTTTTPAADAELVVLGTLLDNPTCIDEIATTLTPRDHASARHELIHNAINTLHHDGHPIDAVSVGDYLTHTGDLDRAGGLAYLHQLTGHAMPIDTALHHAGIIRREATRRNLRARLTELATRIDTSEDPLEALNETRARLDDLADARTNTTTRPIGADIYDALEQLETPTAGTPTAWTALTDTIGGWQPGRLAIFGARPSVGKSVFGVGAALDVARRGQTAIVFSLEMTRAEVGQRLLAACGSVGMGAMQQRALATRDWEKLAKAASHVAELPLVIEDASDLTVAQMAAIVRDQQRTSDVGLVVIDYLGLIAPAEGAPRNDRRVQVDGISRDLKKAAKRLNVPILALTQLNRNSESRSDKRPAMSDLREAGGQEQDADIVGLLHRDLNPDDGDPSVMEIYVAKNRQGTPRVFSLDFLGHYSRLEDRGARHIAVA